MTKKFEVIALLERIATQGEPPKPEPAKPFDWGAMVDYEHENGTIERMSVSDAWEHSGAVIMRNVRPKRF